MRTPDSSDRPTLAGSRRTNWKVWILQEWGLLLLAAALALVIWEITSRRVVKTHILDDVEIRLVVDPSIGDRVGAVITGKTTLDFELFCSEREKNVALEALDVDGRPVLTMRITDDLKSGSRTLNKRIDKYDWPFANHERILVQSSVEAPQGNVFALAPAHPRVGWRDREAATNPTASQLKARGIRAQIKFSEEKVSVMAPRGREDDPAYTLLYPDAVNLVSVAGELVADGDVPFDRELTYELTFEGWRTTTDAADAAWRRTLDLPRILATVTLTQTEPRELQNRLLIQLPEDYEVKDERQKWVGVIAAGRLRLIGTLKGPKAVLDDLAADLGGWAWGLEITDPSQLRDLTMGNGAMGNGTSEWKKVGARFFWFPTKSEYLDKGIEFLPADGQDAFDVEVRWNPRKP